MKKIEISKEILIELLIDKKMSYDQMAEFLNISKTTVIRKLKNYNIKQPKELINEKISKGQSKELDVTTEDLKRLYIDENKSIKELCELYNISKSCLLKNFKKRNIKKPKELERENYKKTMLKKYGASSSFNSEELQKKIEKTNLERYGVINPSSSPIIREKVKQTNLERYGTINPFQSGEIKDKIKKTNLERYGVEYACVLPQAIEANKPYKISKTNIKFSEYLKENNINNELEYNNFDIKISDKDIVIEIDPTFTHNSTKPAYFKTNNCTEPKDKKYHIDKSKKANELGLHCIHIFDWDDLKKIIYLVNNKETLYARKCELKEVPLKECNDFLNNYHLQNTCQGQSIRLGLYYNNELVEVMTFGKPRYNKNYEYELLRLCTHKDYSVTGGTQKLFKYFLNTYNPKSIISYCDKAKFSGEVYDRLNFKILRKTAPSKHWYNIKTGQHITDNLLRQRGFDQLFNMSYGKGTSNEELMVSHGFLEIYDCGQSTYIWSSIEENS